VKSVWKALDYETYEAALKNYMPEEKWKVFDGSRDDFNVARECVDRHVHRGIAIRIKLPDSSIESCTFKELSVWTAKFANMLERLNVPEGGRIAILLEPSLEFYISLIGTLKRGAAAIVCSPLFGPEAMEYRLKDSRPQLLVTAKEKMMDFDTSLVPRLEFKEDLMDSIKQESSNYSCHTSSSDLAVIQYTSGTTGLPKRILYRHKSLVTLAPATRFAYGVKESDSFFCPSSPAWGHGLWAGTLGPLMFGVPTGVRAGKYEPEHLLQALEEFKVNNISAVPTAYRKIFSDGNFKKYDTRIEKLTYTGEYMDMDTFEMIRENWNVLPHSIYGSTEVGPIIVDYAGFRDWIVRPGSLGKPMLGIEVGLLDEKETPLKPGQIGNIAVKLGGKWLLVGDAGLVDNDGYYWYKGRRDDLIKSSGYRIGPEEVENVINKYEAVLESAVIGKPDSQSGQIVKAFVKLRSDYEPTEELKRRIQEFTKSRLSKFAYPKEIEFVEEIPKTLEGKIKRRDLKRV